MVADTNTPILGLLLQGTGNNNNSWGTNLNNSVITPVENAIKGVNAITGLTGGAYTLTQANAAYETITLAGVLTSDLIITVPSTANKWRFINNCTGAFYVLIKVAAGTSRNLPVGKWTDVVSDGTNVYRADAHRVGEYFFHAGSAVPAGALECNAQTPLRASAVDLFTALGTTHGVGNGTTTFTLPDGYTAGKFLRSRTASVAAATVQTNQNKAHTHTFSGSLSLGTLVVDAGGTHTHTGTTGGQSVDHSHVYLAPSSANNQTSGGANSADTGSGVSTNSGGVSADHTHSFTTTTTGSSHSHTVSGSIGLGTVATVTDGGTEARPENISGILCVRY